MSILLRLRCRMTAQALACTAWDRSERREERGNGMVNGAASTCWRHGHRPERIG
jgi:hypothetical protein